MSATSRTARALARFARMSPMDVRIYGGGAVAEYDQAGFAYGDLDRAGHVPVWAIGKHMELDRLIKMWKPEFFFSPHLMGTSAVIRSQIFDIKPLFYEKAGLNCPMMTRIQPGYLGRSSITVLYEVFDKTSGEIMIRNTRQMVYVNNETRAPVQVPASVAAHFRLKEAKATFVETQTPLSNCYSQGRRVYYSDYDYQDHVTSFAYPRWCLDAAANASLSNRLQHFTNDIAEYRLRSLEMLHTGEAFVNDTVNIKVWECDKSTVTLLFQVEKELSSKEERICFCRMTFYPLSLEMPNKL